MLPSCHCRIILHFRDTEMKWGQHSEELNGNRIKCILHRTKLHCFPKIQHVFIYSPFYKLHTLVSLSADEQCAPVFLIRCKSARCPSRVLFQPIPADIKRFVPHLPNLGFLRNHNRSRCVKTLPSLPSSILLLSA